MVTNTDMSKDFARALVEAHDADARTLSRKTRHELAVFERSEMAARGMEHVYGGPVTKEELLRSILDMRYPVARRFAAAHVLHHDRDKWSGCEFCACQGTRIVTSERLGARVIEQCEGQPGHDGDHTWPQS
jgi:hypothetical protein